MNGRGGVKTETALRIKKTMEDMDFQPRWKVLDRDRFLVFIPEYGHAFDSGYVARVMSGITDAAFAAGFGLQLRPFSSQGKDVGELRQLYMQEAVSGCMLISLYQGYWLPDRLDLAKLPHVVVGHKRQDDDIHQVLLDDFDAGKSAVEFLLSLGHKRIAMVSFSHRDHAHLDRYRGFAEAMALAGMKEPLCIQCNDDTCEEGRSAARRLLSPLERPGAVIVTNENIAVGFQAEARAMKFSIPDDLSLMAFEDTDKLSLLDTPMTVMQAPAYEMGIEAVRMLRSTIAAAGKKSSNSGSGCLTKHLAIPLVVRYSTATAK
jgi:DNA-binding LacI/PurR family transcriptional regulator